MLQIVKDFEHIVYIYTYMFEFQHMVRIFDLNTYKEESFIARRQLQLSTNLLLV